MFSLLNVGGSTERLVVYLYMFLAFLEYFVLWKQAGGRSVWWPRHCRGGSGETCDADSRGGPGDTAPVCHPGRDPGTHSSREVPGQETTIAAGVR